MPLDPGVTAQFVHVTQPMDCGMVFQNAASLQSRFGFRLLGGNASASERLFCSYFYFCHSSPIFFFNFFNWSCSVTVTIVSHFWYNVPLP